MEAVVDLNHKVWNCAVCLQPFQDILILPCQHKFCERCLNIWVGVYIDSYRSGQQEFPCRLCWKLFHIPQNGGLSAYRHCHDVYDLGLDLNKMSMDTDECPLDNCNPQLDAMQLSQTDVANSNNKAWACTRLAFGNTSDQPHHNAFMNGDNCQHMTNGTVIQNEVITNSQDMNSVRDEEPMGMRVSNSAPEFNNTAVTHDAQSELSSIQTSDSSDMSVEQTGSNDHLQQQTAPVNTLPMTFPDQNVYGRRLCFPSCHTYMYHLV